jgi:glycerol uptake facilitator-like aquaporin
LQKKVVHVYYEKGWSRNARYILARVRGLRQRRPGRYVPKCTDRSARRILEFGLTVLTTAYAVGHISGCHLNPAVSTGLVVARRFPASDLPAYVIAQLAGAIAAGGALYWIASGRPGSDLSGGFAANGFGAHSPGGYSLASCMTSEVLLTFMFLMIILGATGKRAPAGFAPIAIGLSLTLIPHRDTNHQSVRESGAQHWTCRLAGAPAAEPLTATAVGGGR